jgi:hypothetical protein
MRIRPIADSLSQRRKPAASDWVDFPEALMQRQYRDGEGGIRTPVELPQT